MLLELHIIQNFAPSCLNRDDLNAPKECDFGGVRRARISSQSLKRATRMSPDFASHLTSAIGTRTRFLREKLVDLFVTKGRAKEDAQKAVGPVVAAIGSGVEEDGRTKIALYLSHDEIDRIAKAIEPHFDALLAAAADSAQEADEAPLKGKAPKKPKKGSGTASAKAIADEIIRSLQPGTTAADIALFGRMIAEATHLNVDAAAQVAHAISTHKVPSEFDFFTAVDDLQAKGDPGAGMMGTQQFNSATFYRYANVHLNQLGANLGGDAPLARAAALAFAHAFISAIPNAKQNSHAAHNLPDLVFAVLRTKGQAISLANAFVKPVDHQKKLGLVGESATALADYWNQIVKAYGTEGIAATHFYTVPKECEGVSLRERVDGLRDLLAKLEEGLRCWSPEVRR